MSKPSEQNPARAAARTASPRSKGAIPVHTPAKAVEMRFLVPPHMIETARQAMSSFMIQEVAGVPEHERPPPVCPHRTLTNQEVKHLLRG